MVAKPDTDVVLMRSCVKVALTGSLDKLVTGPSETRPVVMGMHDELAEFYGVAPGSFTPHASTLDYVIGATAACLAGTFKRSLAARGLTPAAGDLTVEAEGLIVIMDGVPVIRQITVVYGLAGIAPSDRAKAERAHAVHHRACAVSRSLEKAIEIATALELR